MQDPRFIPFRQQLSLAKFAGFVFCIAVQVGD